MYSDYHLHTMFSGDSDTDPRLQIERAASLGMEEICLTDHQDFDFPPGDFVFVFDTQKYFNMLKGLQEEYDGRIKIRIGVEAGLQPHLSDVLDWYVRMYPFDYVIGSTHLSRRLDPYEPSFWEGIDEDKAIEAYFQDELENLTSVSCYDVAGHIDFVLRTCSMPGLKRAWPRYSGLIDAMLRHIIEHGKGIECNTSGLRSGQGFPNPHPDILKRYRELGGEIITIGSDAHVPGHVGKDFELLHDMLQDCGFKYYTVFRQRKPEFKRL